MKTNDTKVKAEMTERSTEMHSTGLVLRMRTECRSDCERIQGLLLLWLLSWKETSVFEFDNSHVDSNGVIWASRTWTSDTEVQFTLKENGPNLQEVRWLIDKLVDCHVAAESVNISEQYTGERLPLRLFEKQMSAPSRGIIGTATRALNRQRQHYELFVEQTIQDLEELSEAEQRLCSCDNQSVRGAVTSRASWS